MSRPETDNREEAADETPITYSFRGMTLNPVTGEVRYLDKSDTLNRRQTAVLHYLFRHADQIVTADELHQAIWDGEGAPKKVAVTIYRLRQVLTKLGLSPTIYSRRGRTNPGYWFGDNPPKTFTLQRSQQQ